MSRVHEVATFGCGFEAFHTLLHGALWAPGSTLSIFGFVASPGTSGIASIINGAITVALGLFAWRKHPTRA
ncbi:MAG: hypothetical protein J0L78_08415 [Planctomycetes bacterium]|nr:hypothetical protein [Planctomycetota bacterium]